MDELTTAVGGGGRLTLKGRAHSQARQASYKTTAPAARRRESRGEAERSSLKGRGLAGSNGKNAQVAADDSSMGWLKRIQEFLTVEAPEVRLAQLERLAAIVDQHIATTWPAVGAALQEIHERQLYRETHRTWPDFLHDRWDMSEGHASRLMAAARLHAKTLPSGKTPATERIARPITTLPEEQQLDAWSDAVELAGGDQVKPEHVAAAVAKRTTTTKRPRTKPIRIRVPGATIIIEPGKRGWTSPAESLEAALRQLTQRAAA